MTIENRPYLLTNTIQNYDWGCTGDNAFIPRLLGISPVPGGHYAELWVGAHNSAPSLISEGGNLYRLNELIRKFPAEILGLRVIEKFGPSLPFLFKILSAEKPLSIQVHPDKKTAESLHSSDPVHYPDPNHKPEIAIALDTLTALAGFRPEKELQALFKRNPELASICRNSNPQQADIEDIISHVANFSTGSTLEIKNRIGLIAGNILNSGFEPDSNEKLFLEIMNTYPGDIGLIFVLLLNLVHLESGQALYLDTGVPHAYISGNIAECMANSDNVIRAGLTPKFKDMQALTASLSYGSEVPVISPVLSADSFSYITPAGEYEVTRIVLRKDNTYKYKTNNQIEILGIISGVTGILWDVNLAYYAKGSFILIPALMDGYELKAESDSVVFRVHIPEK